MSKQTFNAALYLIAAVIGGYLCAPYMAEVWIRILPVLRMGLTEEIPVFGGSRWIAVGSVILAWAVVVAPEKTRILKRIAFATVGSFVLFQLGFLALLSSDVLSWLDPDELSWFPTRTMEFWTHFVAMPVNLLITPLGGGIGFTKDGHVRWSHGDLALDPRDVPDPTTAIALHWALLALIALIAIPLIWKFANWLSVKVRYSAVYANERHRRAVLRGWTLLMFLPIYLNGSNYTDSVDVWGAYSNLQALGIIISLGLVASVVITPLFFIVVRRLRTFIL